MKPHPQNPEGRNFVINTVEGSLFLAGATFISVQTVLPEMVKRLGGGNVAVGALGVIAWGGLFLPQIFAARYFETRQWKKPWVIRLGLAQRVLVGIIALGLLLYAETEPGTALAIFVAAYAAMHLVLGAATPGWFDLLAKVTPVTRRGRLAGYRSSLAGVLAFGSSFLLIELLRAFPFPMNYVVAFSLAFLFQAGSLLIQSRIIESEPSPVAEKKDVVTFLREAPDVLRTTRQFRNFALSMAFFVLATVSMTFFSVYALEEFKPGDAAAGTFTLLMVSAQIISAPFMGFVGDKAGNRMTLILAGGAMGCASLWAFFAPSLELFYVVFVFLGINIGSELMARYNLTVEFAPEHRRAVYLGLLNAFLAPCYAVGFLGGLLSDLLGYKAVFLAGTSFSLLGIILMLFFVDEPRRRVPGVPEPVTR